ncbi:MAG TPA: PIN domain-containing protein [Thermoanaerobaculia bacterium]|nr:PIN domain-containing protein [Thermoanaerobaculia bacterium]
MGGGGSLRYLLDSVILIDHFNGRSEATDCLVWMGADSALSVITRAEVLAGFGEGSAEVASILLNRFPTLGIDLEVADLAARFRREHRWKMPDALQAALAHYHGLSLVTRNTKDFPPERYPFVVVPYILTP